MTYLDYAATSPIREVARSAWLEASELLNAGGQYQSGRKARAAVSTARETIASLLNCEPIEVIFCASGTEADNIAIRGLYAQSELNRVVCSPIEHPAVLETVQALDSAEIDWLPVDAQGRVSDWSAASVPAALVTSMWASNETGAVQPLPVSDSPIHVDAVQAIGHVPVSFAESGATTMAASGHKFGGPHVGLLLASRSLHASPLTGGGQERKLRPGTVDVAGAVATAAALEEAVAEMEAEQTRLAALRDRLISFIRQMPDTLIHTSEPALPGHVHVSFPGAEGDSLIMLLDVLGIEAATGSACSSGVNRASHVLLAMGVSERDARSALRFTLGRGTTETDIEKLESVLPDVVERARLAGMA